MPGFSRWSRLRHLRAHGDRAGLRPHDVADVVDRALEHLIRVRRHPDGGLLAEPDLGDVALVDLRVDPEHARVDHRENLARRIDHGPEHGRAVDHLPIDRRRAASTRPGSRDLAVEPDSPISRSDTPNTWSRRSAARRVASATLSSFSMAKYVFCAPTPLSNRCFSRSKLRRARSRRGLGLLVVRLGEADLVALERHDRLPAPDPGPDCRRGCGRCERETRSSRSPCAAAAPSPRPSPAGVAPGRACHTVMVCTPRLRASLRRTSRTMADPHPRPRRRPPRAAAPRASGPPGSRVPARVDRSTAGLLLRAGRPSPRESARPAAHPRAPAANTAAPPQTGICDIPISLGAHLPAGGHLDGGQGHRMVVEGLDVTQPRGGPASGVTGSDRARRSRPAGS